MSPDGPLAVNQKSTFNITVTNTDVLFLCSACVFVVTSWCTNYIPKAEIRKIVHKVSHISSRCNKGCSCQAGIKNELVLSASKNKHDTNWKPSTHHKSTERAKPATLSFVGSGRADVTSIRCLAGCLLRSWLSRPVRASPSSGPAKASHTLPITGVDYTANCLHMPEAVSPHWVMRGCSSKTPLSPEFWIVLVELILLQR